MIISALIYQSYYPDHDFIYEWNNNLQIDETTSNGYIHDAYLKIKGINPSVIINNELYTLNLGTLLLAYDYGIFIPDDIIGDDCDTDYEVEEEIIEIGAYRNNIFFGNTHEINYYLSEDTEFTAILHLYVRTRIEHYEWEEECVERVNGVCVEWEEECEFDDDEIVEHEVYLEDSLDSKLYTEEPGLSFEVLSNNYGSVSFALEVENGWFDIEFDNAYYKKFDHYYGLELNDTITMKAYDCNVTESFNVIYSDGIYTVNSDDCSIIYGDAFRTYEENCDLGYEEYDLEIDTDKLVYDDEDVIHVEIFPSDENVLLKYGSEEVVVSGSYDFEVNPLVNRVTAKLGNEESYKVIHVRDDSDYVLLFDFGVFSGLSYIFYLIVRRYYGGWL